MSKEWGDGAERVSDTIDGVAGTLSSESGDKIADCSAYDGGDSGAYAGKAAAE